MLYFYGWLFNSLDRFFANKGWCTSNETFNDIYIGVIFTLFIMVIWKLIGLPFDLLANFYINREFNRMGYCDFFIGTLKGFAFLFLQNLFLIALSVWLITVLDSSYWLMFVVLSVIGILVYLVMIII